jgi:hypothetical protein
MVVAVMTACSGAESGDGDHVEDLALDLVKGQPGAQPGQPSYCDDPAQLCELGEGDCDYNTQCVSPLVCGRKKGVQFGRQADACVPAHCINKKLDGNESQIDCGGDCGSVCGSPTCSTSNGPGRCTTDCPCAAGEGDCDAANECIAPLVCGRGKGSRFGYAGDACVAAHCVNKQLDPTETSVDCGGECGSVGCPGGGVSCLADGTFEINVTGNFHWTEWHVCNDTFSTTYSKTVQVTILNGTVEVVGDSLWEPGGFSGTYPVVENTAQGFTAVLKGPCGTASIFPDGNGERSIVDFDCATGVMTFDAWCWGEVSDGCSLNYSETATGSLP